MRFAQDKTFGRALRTAAGAAVSVCLLAGSAFADGLPDPGMDIVPVARPWLSLIRKTTSSARTV